MFPVGVLFFTNNKVFYGIDKLPLTIGSYGLLLEIEFTKAFGRIVTQSNIGKGIEEQRDAVFGQNQKSFYKHR